MNQIKLSKGKFSLIKSIIFYPLYLLTMLIPKQKKLLVLGSARGHEISDNAKYLFLYLREETNKKFDFFFLTKSKKVYEKAINEYGNRVLYIYSIKGIFTLVRAKHVLITHAMEDLIPYLLGGKCIHQLWHGSPLKKIGIDADNWGKSKIKDNIKKTIYALFPYTNYMYCHKLYVSSNEFKNVLSKAFNLNKREVMTLGQPRNDFLLQSKVVVNKSQKLKFEKYNKIISWLPTHRGFSSKTSYHLLREYKFDKIEFNEFLVENNYLFIMKPHFVEKVDLEDYISDCSNILIFDEIDPYPLIVQTDILITDYSSILFDYLHLDKQAVFTPFDIDIYTNEVAELYFNYEDIAYGPVCFDWMEVLEELKISDQAKYKNKRKKLKQRFCKEDKNSSSKIIEYILGL